MPAPRSRTMIMSASTSLAACSSGISIALDYPSGGPEQEPLAEGGALEAGGEARLGAETLDVVRDLGGARVVRAEGLGGAVLEDHGGDEAGVDGAVLVQVGDGDPGP